MHLMHPTFLASDFPLHTRLRFITLDEESFSKRVVLVFLQNIEASSIVFTIRQSCRKVNEANRADWGGGEIDQ